jgi:hypothetical protein
VAATGCGLQGPGTGDSELVQAQQIENALGCCAERVVYCGGWPRVSLCHRLSRKRQVTLHPLDVVLLTTTFQPMGCAEVIWRPLWRSTGPRRSGSKSSQRRVERRPWSRFGQTIFDWSLNPCLPAKRIQPRPPFPHFDLT